MIHVACLVIKIWSAKTWILYLPRVSWDDILPQQIAEKNKKNHQYWLLEVEKIKGHLFNRFLNFHSRGIYLHFLGWEDRLNSSELERVFFCVRLFWGHDKWTSNDTQLFQVKQDKTGEAWYSSNNPCEHQVQVGSHFKAPLREGELGYLKGGWFSFQVPGVESHQEKFKLRNWWICDIG